MPRWRGRKSRPLPSGQVTARAATIFMLALCLIGLMVLLSLQRLDDLARAWRPPHRGALSLREALQLLAASRAGARLQLGGAAGLRRGARAPRMGGGRPLWRRHRLDHRLRHDLRPSRPRGRRPARPEIDRAQIRARDQGLARRALRLGLARDHACRRAAGAEIVFLLGMGAAGAHLFWQVATLDIDDPENCLRRFRSNRDFGAIVFAAILLDMVLAAVLLRSRMPRKASGPRAFARGPDDALLLASLWLPSDSLYCQICQRSFPNRLMDVVNKWFAVHLPTWFRILPEKQMTALKHASSARPIAGRGLCAA